MQQRNIRGVVFDLDNTLLRSRHGALRALKAATVQIHTHLVRRGYRYSKHELLRQVHLVDQLMMREKRLYNRDVWWKTLLKELSLSHLAGPWIHKTTMHYWKVYATESPPFNDTESTLKRVKKGGFRIGMVSDTDGTPGMKRKRIRQHDFHKLLETIVVAGEDTPKVKPSKGPFLLVARRLGLSPQECVYVGDNPSTDIDGAKGTGMVMIRIRRDKNKTGHPDFEVRQLREVPKIVYNINRRDR